MSSHLANFNFCSFFYPRFSLRALHCNCSKGWINDENPLEKASCLAKEGFQTPIDEIDAAARILDPIMVGLRPPQRQQRQRPQPANGGGSEAEEGNSDEGDEGQPIECHGTTPMCAPYW